MIYTITKAVALPENEKANVTVEALLESVEEGLDSKGRPFIRATLTDKAAHLPVKMWQTGLTDFAKLLGANDLTSLIVQATGKVDSYNDESQLIISKICKVEKDLNTYINAAPIPSETLYSGIKKKASEIKDKNLKALALAALELDEEKWKICPYSSKNHTEKSGLLYHIYLCLCRILNYSGVPDIAKKEVDLDIVFTAIICSRLTGIFRYTLDDVTGKIITKDEVEKALHGELSNVIIVHDIINNLLNTNKNFEYSAEIENVEHCIASLYCSGIKPATIEAAVTNEIVCAELTMFTYAETVSSLAPGEAKQTQVGFNQRKIVRKWAENADADSNDTEGTNVETSATVKEDAPTEPKTPEPEQPASVPKEEAAPVSIPGPFR